jgi:hydrogenase maturation protein HypF
MAASRFVLTSCPTRLRARVPVLALGVDTAPVVAWQVGGRLHSLCPQRPVPIQDFFPAALRYLKKLRIPFGMIAYDPHPDFEVGSAAREGQERFWPKARLIPVFHHAAHAANFGHDKGARPFIGVAFDGTGFGADRALWGGEFFIFKNKQFRRGAHMRYLRLLGGEQAIREPWRMGFSAAYDAMGPGFLKHRPRFLKGRPIGTLRLLEAMARQGVQSPWTSSVGRLFDATAAILGVVGSSSAAGEAARALERCAAAWNGATVSYPFEVIEEEQGFLMATPLLFQAIFRDLEAGRSAPEIARAFHRTIAEIVTVAALYLRRKTGIRDIYLAGGVFMNEILRHDVSRCLSQENFKLLLAPRPETTDLGIATGQIAAVIMTSEKCKAKSEK